MVVADLEERGILKSLGSSASYEKCDVSSPESCESALNSCIAKHGRLDVLFHNAACLAPVATVIDHDLATFQRVVNTNLCSLFYLARVAVPQMKKQGKGSIVVTGSTSGLAADFGLCAYNAAKAGIMNLARTMAIDHIRDGIRVNIVAPGHMVTPMTIGFYDNAEAKAELLEGIPLGRGCDPKEVAAAVLFLASDEAYAMTGHSERIPEQVLEENANLCNLSLDCRWRVECSHWSTQLFEVLWSPQMMTEMKNQVDTLASSRRCVPTSHLGVESSKMRRDTQPDRFDRQFAQAGHKVVVFQCLKKPYLSNYYTQ